MLYILAFSLGVCDCILVVVLLLGLIRCLFVEFLVFVMIVLWLVLGRCLFC